MSARGEVTARRTESFGAAVVHARYTAVRAFTEHLCSRLEPEDYQLQPMTETSPVKWHLAHTAWFFETFLLSQFLPNYQRFHPSYGQLFNSYYDSLGARISRNERGLISRPTVREVYAYRKHIDDAMRQWLTDTNGSLPGNASEILDVGLQHEQQHQELILTDLKYAFSRNPLSPVYVQSAAVAKPIPPSPPVTWIDYPGGLVQIGHSGVGFSFDNELPRHQVYLNPYSLQSRLVNAAEYMQFMDDGGYSRPELWLSDGWAVRQSNQWNAPLYWRKVVDRWEVFTLAGRRPVSPHEPVCHVSYYEADAFARWADGRLPSEFEWEVAATPLEESEGHFADDAIFNPKPPSESDSTHLQQAFGDCWEWTASPYVGYPGFRAAQGAIGEYNGKFMCNQMVLRGGSCATPRGHVRATYRNFFPPETRWQFSGIRLAKVV